MSARQGLRALGLAPGAAGIRSVLSEFAADGAGVVTALSAPLLRIAADLLDPDGEVRVMTVGELFKESRVWCDEEARSVASRGLFVSALAASAEHLDADSPFYASSRFPGFHRAASSTLAELRRWGIGAEELEQAAEIIGGETGKKLASLAALTRRTRDVLASLGLDDEAEEMERLMGGKPGETARLPRVLVLAGSEIDPAMAKRFRWLSRFTRVDIALELPAKSQDLFSGASQMFRLLDVPVERRGRANGLCEVLFTSNVAVSGPKARINSCSDALAEAEWVIRGCIADLKNGLSPNEIAIYARNLDEYASPLEAAAKRFGALLKMSRRAPVFTNRFARLVLETLEFCATEDPRLIIPLLGCSYLGLDLQMQSDIREQARLAYKARRNAWPVFSGWACADAQAVAIPWLARMMLWREDATKTPQPLRAWAARLQGLIDILPWHASGTEGPTRARDMRVPTALRRAIKNLASVRRDESDKAYSIQEFVTICRTAWEDETYFVPSNETGIAVVANAQSLAEVKSLYAVGMLEGVFPRRRSEDPILTDEDRKLISEALKLEPPLPNSFDEARKERDEFYRLCAATSEKLTLSYPQADDSRDNVPAFYLHEIERALGDGAVRKHDFPRVPFAPQREDCDNSADLALRAALDAPREEALPVQFTTLEVREQFAWPQSEAFAPDDLRQALQCEFRHFASRRLKLKPNREANRWSRLRGLPRSAKLLQQSSMDEARKSLESALDIELESIYGDIPEWEFALLRSGGRRLISEWIKREFSSRELWPKNESSMRVGAKFGDEGVRNMMPGNVPLQGSVAATSQMGPYGVTHLYESQSPQRESISGGPLNELDALYYGLHLLARYEKGAATAVEVESMTGSRTLLVLPRVAEMPLPSRVQDGLEVIDLASGLDGVLGERAFFDEVKRRLKRAVQRLYQSGIDPTPADHCRRCGYGELCRRSFEFSEQESPFGEDDNDYEVD